jgi:hypothetical protein
MSSPDHMSSEQVPELPPDFGRHNMFALGRDTVFLSHLPMFMAPHDAQVILAVAWRMPTAVVSRRSGRGSVPLRWFEPNTYHPQDQQAVTRPFAKLIS